MKKELFNEIFGLMKKLDIPFNIGTRTNVKRLPAVQDMTNQVVSEGRLKNYVDQKGVDLVLKIFTRDGAYIPQLNDLEGKQFLTNLKTFDKIVNPPTPKSAEVHLFSKLPGEKMTPDQYTGKEAANQAKIESAILKNSMRVSKVDESLAERLGLDMSKLSDWEKLQGWKDKYGVPDWAKDTEGGVGSLFKVARQDPLADVGTILDNIEKQGKSLVDQAKKLTDMAYKMSPEGIAAEKAARKALLQRMNEGKGFAGGVMGARSDGYFRAIVRPFLIDQHEKGAIKLADNTFNSLKNSNDIKSGGFNDFMYPDPVRVFRHHYGDDAFDLIPDQEVFGMGSTGYGPGRDRINEVMYKAVADKIHPTVQGPGNPGGYLTKGEYQAKLDELDEVRGYIQRREGRFGDMSQKEITQELADLDQRGATIKMAREQDYPAVEVSGIDAALKSDFTKSALPSKEPLNIRLMKNFDQELTDVGLAQEGYNLQEIQVLKNARRRMTSGEEPHPNEALLREKEILADEAGVDVDELTLAIDWGDMTPEPFALGGGVGSMFRSV